MQSPINDNSAILRWRDEKKWKNENGEIDKKKMNEDMGKMFNAVNDNYQMRTQYKYTLDTLQKFGQFRDKKIWTNFEYLIDWMEINLSQRYFFEVMGKTGYDLPDPLLCRIERKEEKSKKKDGTQEGKTIESWLMSSIFRYVENPDKMKDPTRKYIGKVKFQKINKIRMANKVSCRILSNISKLEILTIIHATRGPTSDPVKYVKEVSHVKHMHAESLLIHPNFSSKSMNT